MAKGLQSGTLLAVVCSAPSLSVDLVSLQSGIGACFSCYGRRFKRMACSSDEPILVSRHLHAFPSKGGNRDGSSPLRPPPAPLVRPSACVRPCRGRRWPWLTMKNLSAPMMTFTILRIHLRKRKMKIVRFFRAFFRAEGRCAAQTDGVLPV